MRAASCALNGQVREAEATGTIGLAARMAGFLSPRVPTKLSTTCLSLSVYSYLGFAPLHRVVSSDWRKPQTPFLSDLRYVVPSKQYAIQDDGAVEVASGTHRGRRGRSRRRSSRGDLVL